MITVGKQIEYWRSNSEKDLDTASILIDAKKYIEGMFFCHMCIEKTLKAHIVKQTEQIPPKSHDLFYLADKAKIEISESQSTMMNILMKYQLEGPYPEYYPRVPPLEKIVYYFNTTKELLQCFNKML